MLGEERQETEANPGPGNHEPWAGTLCRAFDMNTNREVSIQNQERGPCYMLKTSGLHSIGHKEISVSVEDSTLSEEAEQFLRFASDYLITGTKQIRAGETMAYGYWLVKFQGSDVLNGGFGSEYLILVPRLSGLEGLQAMVLNDTCIRAKESPKDVPQEWLKFCQQ